jgi:N-acetylglucosaminyldiphosphoundecaprenol N-acetyl-beta-D-mannosaminyltransferase
MTSRAYVLGCAIDRLDMAGTLARCEEIIHARTASYQVSINAAKLVAVRRDPRLKASVERAAVVSPDGQAIVWASRLLGDPLPERVAGIDLMHGLLALAEKQGYSVFILGAAEEVLEQAVAQLRLMYPRLRIAGHRNGYFSEAESNAVAASIAAVAPDILFVAMSSPKKEYFLDRYGPAIEAPLAMGVGGSIDILAGRVTRAPRWIQHAGLEWLYRISQEPTRLWRRYLTTNTVFLLLLGRELVRRRSHRTPSAAPTRPASPPHGASRSE